MAWGYFPHRGVSARRTRAGHREGEGKPPVRGALVPAPGATSRTSPTSAHTHRAIPSPAGAGPAHRARRARPGGWRKWRAGSTGIRALAHCLCPCSCGAAPVVGVVDDDCVVGVIAGWHGQPTPLRFAVLSLTRKACGAALRHGGVALARVGRGRRSSEVPKVRFESCAVVPCRVGGSSSASRRLTIDAEGFDPRYAAERLALLDRDTDAIIRLFAATSTTPHDHARLSQALMEVTASRYAHQRAGLACLRSAICSPTASPAAPGPSGVHRRRRVRQRGRPAGARPQRPAPDRA